jgi:pyruvate,water dikinase
MAVVIQHYVVPTIASGTLYTRPPGQPVEAWARIEAKDPEGHLLVASVRRKLDEVLADDRFPLHATDLRTLVTLGLRAESLIDAPAGADIEWVWAQQGVSLVQVRPIVHGRAVRSAPAELFDFSQAAPERVWRWDVTHNPDPLSPAQAALVQRESERTGLPMRTVGGYLYTAESEVEPIELSSADELRRFFFETVKPRAEAALRGVEQTQPPSLHEALTAYDAVFAVYARELGPRLEAARGRVHPRSLAGLPPLDCAPSEIEWAAFSPAWDVAVPTYKEVGLTHPHPNPPRGRGREEVDPWAHAVRDISELDDRLFYRAQFAVRRALLARAQALGLRDPSDLFFADAPLAEGLRPDVVLAEAEKNRLAVREASRFHMPLAIQAGRALAEPWSRGADLWRGVGTGKTTVGSVYRFGPATKAPQKGVIVVAAALAPGALLMLRDVAAIVSEFDGLLGHTAALARELGIPCVVRCQGAWRDLSDGDRVFVDGQAGLVVRLA